MGTLVFQATLGGQVNLNGPNTASTFDIAVPATTGTMVTTGDSGTVTNTMLAGSIANAKLTNSSVTVGSTSIALGATSTTLDGVNIGATTAGTGAFTTLSASSTVSGTGFSTYLASPPAIGGTAAAAGSFTTLAASSTVSGTGFSTYLASPPAIGGTAAAAGTFTTLSGTTSVATPIVKSASSLTLQTNGTTTAVTVDTSQNATFVGYINAPNTFGFKNRIINGAMVIDQRNAGASVTPTDGQYTLDRYKFSLAQTSKLTTQQSTTAPTGFASSLLVTSSSAYSVLTGDNFNVLQWIEGYNTADLAWGTASAATVTLSFWVRSSLTGTFGGSIVNNNQNYSYPFSYTISAANTFEYKTITIAGPTAGTWSNTTTTRNIGVWIGLGAGASASGTAGAWAATGYYNATGATSVVGTSGATFYITGVQLEKGSTATSFDYRPYMIEEQLCMRYYEKTIDGANGMVYGITSIVGNQRGTYPFKVRKRATPTVAYTTVQTSVLTVSVDWVAIQRTNDNAEMIGGNYSAEL